MTSKGTQGNHPTGRSVVLEEAGNNLLISTHNFFSFFEEGGEKFSTFDLKGMCKMSQQICLRLMIINPLTKAPFKFTNRLCECIAPFLTLLVFLW